MNGGRAALGSATARTTFRVALFSLLAIGCGGGPPRVETGGRGEPPPAPVEIVETETGARLEPAALAAALDGIRVIYVGERHDRPGDHAAQQLVIEALHDRDPSLAIGMEMFQHPYQASLDAWIAGAIDEEALLAGTEWRERWNVDFALYRGILEFARERRIRIVALNARRELTRAIAREGLESLPPELRAELPELDLDDGEHRAMVMDALAAHPHAHGEGRGHGRMDASALERFYLAQLVWDESMGARVADFLAREGAPRRMVVLAGRMHVERGLGIPRRAARRGARPFRVLLPLDPVELPPAARACDYALLPASPTSSTGR